MVFCAAEYLRYAMLASFLGLGHLAVSFKALSFEAFPHPAVLTRALRPYKTIAR